MVPPAGCAGGQKPPFPGAGAKLRLLSKAQGRARCHSRVAGEGEGTAGLCETLSCVRLPRNAFKVLTCFTTRCERNKIVAPGSS